ncbi:MAG: Ada metal-binding domain-containing protein, partial [Pseudomonadales bacterium]|nr:Ada metal-binding domain-containing protein [Pseudomonadales bacterium]
MTNAVTRRRALDEARCWRALENRDASAEDFRYAVLSTGIVCRPGCPSRLPRRENVLFFPTTAAALAAGFRPCRRCRPAQAPGPAWLERACVLIAETPER